MRVRSGDYFGAKELTNPRGKSCRPHSPIDPYHPSFLPSFLAVHLGFDKCNLWGIIRKRCDCLKFPQPPCSMITSAKEPLILSLVFTSRPAHRLNHFTKFSDSNLYFALIGALNIRSRNRRHRPRPKTSRQSVASTRSTPLSAPTHLT